MTRKNLHKITFTLLILISSISSKAQYASEEELKSAANEMFDQENYVGSIKLFGQLLSNYPKDASYNYKYGACLLFGSSDKDKSLRYLKFAVTKPNVDPLAYYYLAKAHHHNYAFSKAIVNYNLFKDKGSSKIVDKYDVDRNINMCQNGQQLIKSMLNIGVLSNKEIKSTDFFRSYKLNGIGGKIIVKPDDFKTKLDNKKNENSVIYLGEKKDMVVYSSYGKDGSTGKDIYKVVKLASGEWSKPVSISNNINTKFDEDYPFLHPDGKTLYFSSKGYNSMGGYDVFKSVFDASTGNWGVPENLDFPINTPDDDILYISDIENKLAYFASTRASKQGEITVYNVTVDATPVENSVIKGFFIAESNPSIKDATITVMDVESERRYGVYKTHQVDGAYLLSFPSNGGKFKLLVETTDTAPVHAAVIELPELDGFRALKQELRLVGLGNDEKLVVKNLFDESDEFDINDPLFVQNILKSRAKLAVNTTEEELNNKPKVDTNLIAKNESVFANLSDADLVNQVKKQTDKINEQTSESKKLANTSFNIAKIKSVAAKKLYKEAKTLMANGEVLKAESKKVEASKMIDEVMTALTVAKSIENEAVERGSDLKKVNTLKESINLSIENEDRLAAEKQLATLNEITEASYFTTSAIDTEIEILEKDLITKQAIFNKDREKVVVLKNREYELMETIEGLQSELKTIKKKKGKAEIQARIDAIKIDLEDTRFDVENAQKKEEISKPSYLKIKNQLATTTKVIAAINSNDTDKQLISDNEKLQLENDVQNFKNEGLVGLKAIKEPTVDAVAEVDVKDSSYKIEEHKNEFEIINNEGEIIDYNSKYTAALPDSLADGNVADRAKIVIKINESWIKDIDEEIKLRENQLAGETALNKKIELTEKIEALKTLKQEKQNQLSENTSLIADNVPTNSEVETSANKSEAETPTVDDATKSIKEQIEAIDTKGNVVDYKTAYTNKLKLIEDNNENESFKTKAAIHANWAKTTEQEISFKKEKLATVEGDEKNELQNEIAILESNLMEQREFSDLYNMQIAAEVEDEIATETTTTNNENVNNEATETETNTNTPLLESENLLTETKDTTTENNAELAVAETVIEDTIVNSENETNTEAGNYQKNYIAQLDEVDDEDTYENSMKKANIHNNWVAAIKTEISEKETTLLNASEGQKNDLENEIAILQSNLLEQEEFAMLYQLQAETQTPIANNQNKDSELATNEITSEVEETDSLELEPIVNNENNVADVLNKEEITDVNENATEVNELIANEAVNNTTENITAKNELEESEIIANTENENKAIEDNKKGVQKLTENELTENNLNSPEDDFSNLKYNNTFNYTSNQSKAVLRSITELKQEAKDLKEEGTEKSIAADKIRKKSEREKALSESEDILNKASRKEEEIAKVYENANRNEFYKKQALISKLKTENTNLTTDNAIRVDLLIEESDNYYSQAKDKREEAENAPNFNVKENALQKAYELEMKAIEKQLEVTYMLTNNNNDELLANTTSNEERLENKNIAVENESVENETPLVEEVEIASLAITKPKEEVTQADEQLLINLEPFEVSAAKETEDFKTYAALKTIKRRLVKEAEVEYVLAEKLAKEISEQKQLEKTLKAKSDEALNAADKQSNKTEIEQLEKAIAENSIELNKIKEQILLKQKKAQEAEDKSNNILNNTDEQIAKRIVAIEKAETFDVDLIERVMAKSVTLDANKEPLTLNESNINNTELIDVSEEKITPENIDVIPSTLSKSIFVINKNKAVYNETKRIPTTTRLPEGLVFKVQVGAFRNAIPQDHFKGFAPILAENAGNGITRYTAGLFNAFNAANQAKDAIREIGYSDAFVVAFFNGKRININEARAMLSNTAIAANTATNNTVTDNVNPINKTEKSTENQAVVSTEKTIPQTEINTTTANQPILTQEVKDGVSTDVRNISGAFYTIQVGVYSKPVTANQLNNVSPLNSERTASGLIRYTSGVYKTLDDANKGKDKIRALGISDAFVVAYKAGKKITIAVATASLNENTELKENDAQETPQNNEDNKVENELPENTSNTTENTIDEENSDNTAVADVANQLNIVFKVKLGEYTEEVPVEDAGLYLKLNGRGVKIIEENNKTIYTIGSFSTYQSAKEMQAEMKTLGIKNPETIAFKDNNQIEIEAALDLIKNNQ
ncbi:MAG: hypothetical protein ACPGSL_00130 [Vicingaceae bacterium]